MLFPTISIFPLFSLLFLTLTLTQASPLTKRYDSVKIRSRRNDHCLTPSPSSDIYTNGTPLTTVNCSFAALWDISPGAGSVILSGTEFALDAGSGEEDNEDVKIWHSYPGLFQQTWYRTYDQRIAILGGDQCLDLGDDGPQTYECTSGNTNQIWTLNYGGGGSTTTTTASSSGPTPTPRGTID